MSIYLQERLAQNTSFRRKSAAGRTKLNKDTPVSWPEIYNLIVLLLRPLLSKAEGQIRLTTVSSNHSNCHTSFSFFSSSKLEIHLQMMLADLGTLASSYQRYDAADCQTDCHGHQTESQTWVCHAENGIVLCFHEVTRIPCVVVPHLSDTSLDVTLLECVLKRHNRQEILSTVDMMSFVNTHTRSTFWRV